MRLASDCRGPTHEVAGSGEVTVRRRAGVGILGILMCVPVAGRAAGPFRCVEGMAGDLPCHDVHVLSHLDLGDIGAEDDTIKGNDHWGWTDAVTGREYVIFGLTNGTAFVDITEPESPVYVGKLPSHDGVSVWHDIKVHSDHAFIVADVPTEHGLQVFDLRQLREVQAPPVTFIESAHYDGFGPGHNLWINQETGYLYVFRTDTCGGGVHMVDLEDPLAPAFAGCFGADDAPLSDGECLVYQGPDPDYIGRELCFIGSDDNVTIADVTDKAGPSIVSTFIYPGIERAHQGALTPDHRHWLLSDTLDEVNNGHPTRTYVFDVSDLDQPIVLGSYDHATNARDHNLYIIGDTAYQANWKAGLRILDIGALPQTGFTETGFLDIDPGSDSVAAAGAWNNYPWWRDAVISVSGTDEGLLVVGQTRPIASSTFIGGELSDRGNGVVVDAAGFTYVAGTTQSTVFPDAKVSGGERHGVDAFVAKYDPSGGVVYVIWVNATAAFAEDQGFAVATDGAGNAYVTGMTNSSDFCAYFGTVPGQDTTYNGTGDAFVFKVSSDGSSIDYCTYLGGTDWDIGRGLAVDPSGVATVTGGTWSADFPVTPGAFAEQPAGTRDAFVARLDPTGTSLVYSTYLGGSGQEEARGLAEFSDGTVVLAGWTSSADLPTTPGAVGPDPAGDFDGFVARLNASGSGLVYATYLGGTGEDRAYAVEFDASGHAFVAGLTKSADFPTTDGAFDTDQDGPTDGFVARICPAGEDIVYSTFVGGSDEDWVNGIALNSAGNAIVTGETWSVDLPTSTRAQSVDLRGARDAYVLQLSPDGQSLAYGTYLGGSDWDDGQAVADAGPGWVVVTGGTRSADFPVTPDAVDPDHNGDHDAFVTRLAVSAGSGALAGLLFTDGFESGDTSRWAVTTP